MTMVNSCKQITRNTIKFVVGLKATIPSVTFVFVLYMFLHTQINHSQTGISLYVGLSRTFEITCQKVSINIFLEEKGAIWDISDRKWCPMNSLQWDNLYNGCTNRVFLSEQLPCRCMCLWWVPPVVQGMFTVSRSVLSLFYGFINTCLWYRRNRTKGFASVEMSYDRGYGFVAWIYIQKGSIFWEHLKHFFTKRYVAASF